MARRLLYLNGLAALLIPFHHAAAYGFNALVAWQAGQPAEEQLNSLAFFLPLIIRQLDSFAIPAFLFVSGYFVAFSARGITRDSIFKRIRQLIWPWLIWTLVVLVLLARLPGRLDDLLSLYYYVPLVIQLLLLSPFLAKLARDRWKLLLVLSALLQFGVMGLRYTQALGLTFPGMPLLLELTPLWFFPGRIFYFSLGVVFGIHLGMVKDWLHRNRRALLVVVILSAILSIPEYNLVSALSHRAWIGPNFGGVMRTTYAVTFILMFIAFENARLPGTKQVQEVGGRSLGVYLMNTPVIYVVSSLMFHFTPWLYDLSILYIAVLILTGLTIPLLAMQLVLKGPLRPAYRYLFG